MTSLPCTLLPDADMARLDTQFPEHTLAVTDDVMVSIRECGPADTQHLPLVCLHGISSGAASWLDLAQHMAAHTRVIAWDAPGYGTSTPLPQDVPHAGAYAQRLQALLDALGVARCVLVGHSLGALMAASAAWHDGLHGRIAALVLISPAQGYGAPGREAERAQVHAERTGTLHALGIEGMAMRRAARLLSDQASPQAQQWVRWNMARLNERGYRQAIEMLCAGDMLADLPPPAAVPVTVACGALDRITPPVACGEVAKRCGVMLHTLENAGHACYVERPEAVATLLRQVLQTAETLPVTERAS